MENKINIDQVIVMLVRHIKLILILAILFGGAVYYYKSYKAVPRYMSSGQVYVQNKVSNAEYTTVNDFSAANRLAVACSTVFTTDKVLTPISNDLKEEYGINLSTGALKSMISVNVVKDSEILSISVTGSDPVQAYHVCSKIMEIGPDAYKELFTGGTMVVVDDAKINYGNINKVGFSSALKGVIIGAVIGIAIALVYELLNKKVKADDDLYKMYGIPVFAEILRFDASAKSKAKYGRYGRYGSYGSYGGYGGYGSYGSYGDYETIVGDSDKSDKSDKESKEAR